MRDADRVEVYDTGTFERLAALAADKPSGIFLTARAHRIGLYCMTHADPAIRSRRGARCLDRRSSISSATFRCSAAVCGARGTAASEGEVLDRLGRLQAQGAISRIGAVLTPHRAGCSTLAAMAVPGR